MTNIVRLPNTNEVIREYRGRKLTIKLNSNTHKWHWQFKDNVETIFEGDEDELGAAIAKAHATINYIDPRTPEDEDEDDDDDESDGEDDSDPE